MIFESGRNLKSALSLSENDAGGWVLSISAISRPASDSFSSPRARAIRRSLPKMFVATGNVFLPLSTTFSNNRALPPSGFFDSTSVNFEISITGETGSFMCFTSPIWSRKFTNSPMLSNRFFICPTPSKIPVLRLLPRECARRRNPPNPLL